VEDLRRSTNPAILSDSPAAAGWGQKQGLSRRSLPARCNRAPRRFNPDGFQNWPLPARSSSGSSWRCN